MFYLVSINVLNVCDFSRSWILKDRIRAFFFERLLIKENSSSCVVMRPPQIVVLETASRRSRALDFRLRSVPQSVMYVRSCKLCFH